MESYEINLEFRFCRIEIGFIPFQTYIFLIEFQVQRNQLIRENYEELKQFLILHRTCKMLGEEEIFFYDDHIHHFGFQFSCVRLCARKSRKIQTIPRRKTSFLSINCDSLIKIRLLFRFWMFFFSPLSHTLVLLFWFRFCKTFIYKTFLMNFFFSSRLTYRYIK